MKRAKLTAENLRDNADRLREIRDEIKELAHEAFDLVKGTDEEDRSKGYWYAAILCALDHEHGYASREETIEDAAEALEEEAADMAGDELDAEEQAELDATGQEIRDASDDVASGMKDQG